MRLWLLRPVEGLPRERSNRNPREPWYDKCFGHVVRAETEEQARAIADTEAGDENERWRPVEGEMFGGTETMHPWLDPELSTCVPLSHDGDAGPIIKDERFA